MTKTWGIIGIVLMVAGIFVFSAVMSICGWDFTRLSTVRYETNVHDVKEKFSGISVDTDIANILFVESSDGNCTVACREEKNLYHTVSVQDGILTVQVENHRKWYEYIGIHSGTQQITVSLPAGNYGALSVRTSTGKVEIPKAFTFESIEITGSTGDVTNLASVLNTMKIHTGTGDIRVEGVSASALDLRVSTGQILLTETMCSGNLKVHVSTGKTYLTDVRCVGLTSDGNTGDITLKNVIAAGKINITRTTGDVIFDGCNAAELTIRTDTGDVKGTLLSEKIFMVHTNTGKIRVPKTVSGGICEVTTSTGDIRLEIP